MSINHKNDHRLVSLKVARIFLTKSWTNEMQWASFPKLIRSVRASWRTSCSSGWSVSSVGTMLLRNSCIKRVVLVALFRWALSLSLSPSAGRDSGVASARPTLCLLLNLVYAYGKLPGWWNLMRLPGWRARGSQAREHNFAAQSFTCPRAYSVRQRLRWEKCALLVQ